MDGKDKKTANKFVKKLESLSRTPGDKKHGLRMLPFIESSVLVNTVAQIVKEHELGFLWDGQLGANFAITEYYYCIDLLVLYAVHEKENYEKIMEILEGEIDKENNYNKEKKERGGDPASVFLRILNFYKEDTHNLDKLIEKIIEY